MSNAPVFRRKITPTERLYFSTRQVTPPFVMHLAVHGDGSLDPAALQAAVDLASAAAPGARLVRDGRDWVDSGLAATVRVVPGWSLNYDALEHDAVLNSPIGPTPDRTTEVLLLTGAQTTVLFRAFHGVMDGMGLRLWVDDVLRALRGRRPVGAPHPVADAELVARTGAAGRPTLVLPTFKAPSGRGRQDPAAPRWLLRHRTIEATGKGIVARVAAILAGESDAKSRFMIPVDLRRHDPALRSTANLALPLFLDVAPGEDWETVRERMRSGLREKRELNELDNGKLSKFPDAVIRAVLRGSNWLGARLNRNMVSATVSHLGAFDLDEMAVPGWTPTTMRVLPQHSGAMPLLFAMVESRGKLELTVSCRNGAGIEPRLEALLDTITARLEAELAPHDAAVG
ncbi:peptide synthetase [Nocardia implantans]|uniref:Peptide synthetase n=1 Tax=Nocardia implantans TaxID=3108168 RepID=A0ABU6AUS7_9NOCA|nr:MULTISPECIES: peptide synthetase [unclassified Nocardia]MBF6192627.1 peptide synthetase [Nocardia beijingensis]MEA3527466.1 peptide synthetase [Nocardia sp. CDC192]MEB3511174.1 peptide synthetase [Nocardia sp. CDC186]